MKLKNKFPYFKKNKKDIYLDSAASSLKLDNAINENKAYLEKYGVNIDRGMYKSAIDATNLYEAARLETAKFINADKSEIIFTSGTTDSLNILANSISPSLEKDDEILTTIAEHNSAYLPWYNMMQKYNFKIKLIEFNDDFEIDLNLLRKSLTKKTKYFVIAISSNVLGNLINYDEIIKVCHENNTKVILDAAQAIAHIKIDVKKSDIDFLAFSAHKIYSTNGLGVLYGKYDLLKNITPYKLGGGTISGYDDSIPLLKRPPYNFEAGTPNISEAISLKASLMFLNKIGFDNILKDENELIKYTLDNFKKYPKVILLNKNPKIPIFSFNIKGIHPHDVGHFLSEKNICLRSGFHCAERLLKYLNCQGGCVRISYGIYTTKKDIDIFFSALSDCINFFKGVDF